MEKSNNKISIIKTIILTVLLVILLPNAWARQGI